MAEQEHEATFTTTASAVLPVPARNVQLAQQPWIQQSCFLRHRPSQEFHLICLWGTAWAASLTAWRLRHYSEQKTWGLPSSWSLPPKEWKLQKGISPPQFCGDCSSHPPWVYFLISFIFSSSLEMSQISVKYFIQPGKKPFPFTIQSEKFWFHVNPRIFFPFFFFPILPAQLSSK